jgi:hypothetical protein
VCSSEQPSHKISPDYTTCEACSSLNRRFNCQIEIDQAGKNFLKGITVVEGTIYRGNFAGGIPASGPLREGGNNIQRTTVVENGSARLENFAHFGVNSSDAPANVTQDGNLSSGRVVVKEGDVIQENFIVGVCVGGSPVQRANEFQDEVIVEHGKNFQGS